MDPRIMVRRGAKDAPDGFCLLHLGAASEKAAVRWSRVGVSVVSACPIGKATNSTRPQYFLRAAMSGEYSSVFSASLMSQPMFLHKPISMMIMMQWFLLNEVAYREGESGALSH